MSSEQATKTLDFPASAKHAPETVSGNPSPKTIGQKVFGLVILLTVVGFVLFSGKDMPTMKNIRHGIAVAIDSDAPSIAGTAKVANNSPATQKPQRAKKSAINLYRKVVVGHRWKYNRHGKAHRVPVYNFRRV